jgi:type II secretory pathway component PulF
MNYDEFAFFNQQLGAMLREGLPLEGALKQLSEGMRVGPLRAEVEALNEDLASGTPLKEALARRHLPEFYKRMLEVGAASGDLPGVLTLLADHYHRVNATWTRLKGLMVYPIILVVVGFALTLALSLVFRHFLTGLMDQFAIPFTLLGSMWVPPLTLAVIAVVGAVALYVPSWRARLRWRLPAFREASLAQIASAMALMLKKGTPLAEALGMAEALESGTPAGSALGAWRQRVAAGEGKPSQWPVIRPFPPLFLWLVSKGGEDAATGFQKAAEIYQGRASYRIELALYGALPISILFLGQLVFWQVAPLVQTMGQLMNTLGSSGD